MKATTTRTDIHRPSAIDPVAYEFVGCEHIKIEDVGDIYLALEYQQQIRRHMARTGGTYSRHQHGGNCHVCGAHCIYTAIFYHAETNTYIRTGFDCAAKMDMGDERAFRAFKAAIDDARTLRAGKQKAAAVLADAGLRRAWELYELADRHDDDSVANLVECGAVIDRGEDCPSDRYRYVDTGELLTLRDIVGKLVRYGSISDGQERYLAKLVDRIDNRKRIEAERAAEREQAADCPNGRRQITGTILKTEVRDGIYGTQLKMTVKADSGFIVWGTVPVALEIVEMADGLQRGLERGDRVTFTATIQPSDRDAKFGFFKRPSKAAIVS